MTAETKPLRLYRVTVELEFAALAASPDEACGMAERELESLGSIAECAYARLSASESYTMPLDYNDSADEYPVQVPRGDRRRLSWSQAVGLDRQVAVTLRSSEPSEPTP